MSEQSGGTGQESGSTSGGQAQGAATDQGTGQASGTQGTEGATTDFDPETIQDPAVKAYLEKLQADATTARREAAKYRTERNQTRQSAEELRRQSETDTQRQEREQRERDERMDRLESENRDLRVGSVVRDAAVKAKAHNPERVYHLIQSAIELDDRGQPANVEDLLRGLRQTDPYLFRRGSATAGDAGAGGEGEGSPAQSMNDLIRGSLGRGSRAGS